MVSRGEMEGMDAHQVRNLANLLAVEANEIKEVVASMTAVVDGLPWKGPDSERFVAQWKTRHVTALRRAAAGLDVASRAARENAIRQENASRS